jgi:hypothetical protein
MSEKIIDKLLKELHKFTSTDQERKRLWGILHDYENQVLIATDGRQLAAVPRRIYGSRTWVLDYLTGEEIDSPSPVNWKLAYPSETFPLEVSVDRLLKIAKKAAKLERIKRGTGHDYVVLSINEKYFIPKQIVNGIKLLKMTTPPDVKLRCLGNDRKRSPLLIEAGVNHFYVTMPLGEGCVGYEHEIIEVK